MNYPSAPGMEGSEWDGWLPQEAYEKGLRDASTNFEDVGVFHEKFGLPVADEGSYGPPNDLTENELNEMLLFRYKFMMEELSEFARGMHSRDMADMADALIDLVYVAMGTAHKLGLPWQRLWDEVQQANMAKERAAKDGSNSKRDSEWDVVKPEGWTPPDIHSILRDHGYHT